MHRSIVIVGSGPAAAIYAARADLAPIVLRDEQWGGLIATAAEVENYPGFVEPIGGGVKAALEAIHSLDAPIGQAEGAVRAGEPAAFDTVSER